MEDRGSAASESEGWRPAPGADPPSSLPSGPQEEADRISRVAGAEPTEASHLLTLTETRSQEAPKEPAQEQSPWTLACPSRGLLNAAVTNATFAVLLWAVCWAITGPESLPGGRLFSLLALLYAAVAAGLLLGLARLPSMPPLPPLLGMLLAGFLLRNVPGLDLQIPPRWSSTLRSLALAVILVRAGLGLDSKALRRLKGVCARLAAVPCLVEACSAALLTHFLLSLAWPWAFLLGFVLAAVSPAVVVPSMLQLQAQRYGVVKGVPTLLMAAGSLDDILALTGFNTCLGVAFATGSTLVNVLRGGLEVAVGVASGALLGVFIQYCPSDDQALVSWRRACLTLGLAVLAVFSSLRLGLPGSGGLCALVLAFLAGRGWAGAKAEVETVVGAVWTVAQPFLFGLIGAEVSVTSLKPDTVGLCVATLGIAVLVRVLTTFLVVCGAGFNLKEKVFIAFAWLPKATVQAAIGSVALDTARAHSDREMEEFGLDVLTTAFLAILITAPVGSLLIGLLGPRLLQRDGPLDEEGGGKETALPA